MAATLPQTSFDVVIVGTGLCESILAASLSLCGASVLHLDPNPFYGLAWSTLTISEITTLAQHEEDRQAPPGAEQSGEQKPFPRVSCRESLFPLGVQIFKSKVEGVAHPLLKPSSIHIDLTPRPLMAASPLIDMLARTNAGHYIDFRPVDALLQSFTDDQGLMRVEKVPASRSDVFQSDFISIIEKRLLTRFLKLCIEEDESKAPPSTSDPFSQFMGSMKLSDKLKTFIQSSIVFQSNSQTLSTQAGIDRVKQFANSLIRFGTRTPFLFANHGTGELTQALCRLCAVHGGTYILRRHIVASKMVTDVDENQTNEDEEKKTQIITSSGEQLDTKHLFIAPQLFPTPHKVGGAKIWRMTLLLDNPAISPSRCMLTTRLGDVDIRIRQMDHTAYTCPPGLFILYAETIDPVSGGTERDLVRSVSQLVDLSQLDIDANAGDVPPTDERLMNLPEEEEQSDYGLAKEKPHALWAMTYARPFCYRSSLDVDRAETQWNAVVPNSNEVEHDVQSIVEEAERCFRLVFTDDDKQFFPDLSDRLMGMMNDYGDIDEEGEDEGARENDTGNVEKDNEAANNETKDT